MDMVNLLGNATLIGDDEMCIECRDHTPGTVYAPLEYGDVNDPSFNKRTRLALTYGAPDRCRVCGLRERAPRKEG